MSSRLAFSSAQLGGLVTLAVLSMVATSADAGEINSCKYLLVIDFTNDPYGIAQEFRNQGAVRGFVIVSSMNDVPAEGRLKTCVMNGSWSAIGARGHVAMRVVNFAGSLLAEASANGTAWVNASRTVRGVVSKIYSELGYTGFDETTFQSSLERQYPSRPTVQVTEEIIKNSDPKGVEGIWTDTEDRYRLGIVAAPQNSGSDYLAVVLRSNELVWHPGEIKAELRSTASPNVFTCTYYMQTKKPIGTTLTLEQNSLLRGSPVNVGTTPFNLLLVRVWPKISQPSSTETEAKNVEAGTGFLITHSGLIATNWHVVENAKNITVAFRSWGGAVRADLVVKDKINDLAVLRVSDTSKLQNTCSDLPFQLANSSALALGQPVSTVGYPLTPMLGSNPKFAEGVISSKSGLQDDPRWLQISAQVQPGSSGSPLFDRDGNVVGIVVARLDDAKVFQAANAIPQNVNFAIKSDYLLSLLSMVSGEPLATRTTVFSPEKASQCVALINAW